MGLWWVICSLGHQQQKLLEIKAEEWGFSERKKNEEGKESKEFNMQGSAPDVTKQHETWVYNLPAGIR